MCWFTWGEAFERPEDGLVMIEINSKGYLKSKSKAD